MNEYQVTWAIDVTADSAYEAANKARAMQMPPTTATVFKVNGEDIDVALPPPAPEPSKPVLKVPPLEMDVSGEYQGNAYPSTEEYRVHAVEGDDETYLFSVEDRSGGEVTTFTLSAEEAEGVIEMSTIDHGLNAYEDDWKIPTGIDRQLTWDIGTGDVYLVLSSGHIDEIASWLSYATGVEDWTGGDQWEF